MVMHMLQLFWGSTEQEWTWVENKTGDYSRGYQVPVGIIS